MKEKIFKPDKNAKIRLIPDTHYKSKSDFLEAYVNSHKYYVETDEEKLEKMDIKVIEAFLRKKKLSNFKND